MVGVFKHCKKMLWVCLVALMCVSCGAKYKVMNEDPNKAKPIAEYKSLYIGWLDLREADYAQYGYGSKEEWKKVIQARNLESLQPRMKEMFPGKTLHFAGPDDTQFPQQGDLYIKFDVERINCGYNLMGGVDHLITDVSFFDVKTQEQLYKSSVKAASMGFGPKLYGFEGRLGFSINSLCSFVQDRLQAQ